MRASFHAFAYVRFIKTTDGLRNEEEYGYQLHEGHLGTYDEDGLRRLTSCCVLRVCIVVSSST